MKSQALPQYLMAGPWFGRSTRGRLLRFINDRFLWLPLGAFIALGWAHIAGESYFTFAQAMAFPVNEIGMALFLGLVTQEAVEATMPGGALHTWRRWSLPVVAALGGVVGAAFAFLGFVSWRHEAVLVQAWPVACAIDLAAGYYVLKTIVGRSGALSFFVVIGIVTNAVGLLILALRPAFTMDHLGSAVLLVVAMSVAAMLRHSKVRAFWPYLAVCGTLSWFAFYLAGVHPALALIPIVPFLSHEPRDVELFADRGEGDGVRTAEHTWSASVQVVLFFFGLANAGVLLRGYDTGTWAILVAALIGRPVGVMVAVALAVAGGLHLPRRIGWRELTVVALATSSGFTFALFAATSILPVGAVLAQVKVGALATAAGALATYGLAKLLCVGRFAPALHR